ncbi:MAG: cation transporter [Myxococcaceae bacterium]|nr:cation transporter [Myxococcaceae bacterium]
MPPPPPPLRELRAIYVAIGCSVIGVVAKFFVGYLTGSMSMISSAVDSVGDLFVSFTNLFVVRIAARAPDADHNYGHAKAEGLGAMFEGGFIFASAAFIIYESLHRLTTGHLEHDSTLGIIVMLPLIGMTIGTVLFLRKVAASTGSLVVKADAVHYLSDVYVNVGVLVALGLVKITGVAIIDPIIAILIGLNMFRASWGVVREGVAIVMDESLDQETVEKVREVLASTPGIDSFHELKTRVGKIPHVDFHVVVAGETSTKDVHDVFLEIRRRIREIVGPTTKVLMHADPAKPSPAPRS